MENFSFWRISDANNLHIFLLSISPKSQEVPFAFQLPSISSSGSINNKV